MRHKDERALDSAEKAVRDIRRHRFSAEDKIRVVLEGLRGEDSIAELCRKEGIAQNLYYRWSKEGVCATPTVDPSVVKTSSSRAD